uniref:Uncharacterized protein n=1 Tax=Knipowitschia caucasica TaxID=637954 RepID=A0AAV2MPD3_KNICA
MRPSPRARASPSASGSSPGSLNDLFVPPSPVPDRSRKSARLASQDAGSVRTFLTARGVVPGPDATPLQLHWGGSCAERFNLQRIPVVSDLPFQVGSFAL